MVVYILPLTPVTPEGGWDKRRINFHTLETSDTILKKDGLYQVLQKIPLLQFANGVCQRKPAPVSTYVKRVII